MPAFAVGDTTLIERGIEVEMIGMGGELVEGGWATAEMQISRWRAAGDQIPYPESRGEDTAPCITCATPLSSQQIHFTLRSLDDCTNVQMRTTARRSSTTATLALCVPRGSLFTLGHLGRSARHPGS